MKKLVPFLVVLLAVSLLAGCAGTPVVYYTNCTCPTGSHVDTPAPNDPVVPAEGAVKTGLAILPSISGSKNAAAEENGTADYDVSIVAVTVDDNGVIQSCIIDSIGSSSEFDATGNPVNPGTVEVKTKNELGYDYGMVAYKVSTMEWFEQAAALAEYAVGKTVDELKNGAVNESGKAKDADLAAKATITIGGYVDAIEKAVANAVHLGAQAGDELKLAVISTQDASAGQESGGMAQLNVDAAAVTMKGDVITSCAIDALQAKVEYDGAGVITTDLSAAPRTKNELGEEYGMKAIAYAKFEWYEQAANFAAYVTGKTAAEVSGIAVSEGKPADADLSATVTIAIGGFQALIAKAAQ